MLHRLPADIKNKTLNQIIPISVVYLLISIVANNVPTYVVVPICKYQSWVYIGLT